MHLAMVRSPATLFVFGPISSFINSNVPSSSAETTLLTSIALSLATSTSTDFITTKASLTLSATATSASTATISVSTNLNTDQMPTSAKIRATATSSPAPLPYSTPRVLSTAGKIGLGLGILIVAITIGCLVIFGYRLSKRRTQVARTEAEPLSQLDGNNKAYRNKQHFLQDPSKFDRSYHTNQRRLQDLQPMSYESSVMPQSTQTSRVVWRFVLPRDGLKPYVANWKWWS